MRRFVAMGPALVLLIVAAAAWWVVPGVLRRLDHAETVRRVELARGMLAEDDLLTRLDAAVRRIASAVEPSVVHVEVIEGAMGSSGSGWVYDDRGHVVTNAHVVRGARAIRVQFFDGRIVPGVVVGADVLTDVAVIRVSDTGSLVPAVRASSAVPQQGDRVFAFGSPFGFKFSMSEGIVSGLGRIAGPSLDMGGFSNLIQTDAAVNPGNSGGPLADAMGRVVGMNVAIATARDEQGRRSEGQSAGISFAIPISAVEYVVDQLITRGRVSRGFLGVSFPRFSETEQIRHRGEFKGSGIRVERVTPGGPADAGGLAAGDIVVTINGQSTATFANLRAIVSSTRPGEAVRVRAWRDDRFIDAEVTLGEMPPEAIVGDNPEFHRQMLVMQLGIDARRGEGGVTIRGVVPGSPADWAGLTPGLMITGVGTARVVDLKDLAVALLEQGWSVGRELTLGVIDPRAGPSARPSTVVVRPRAE